MKKFISCVTFVVLVLLLVSYATDVLTPKSQNRYYILEKYLEDHPEDNVHDVQVFGSCHSYTSFNPIHFEEITGASAFVYGNAGEIIPTTYARMVDQFKKHTPKVALVEIWGINPYETYSSHKRVFGFYLANNLERTDFSLEKQQIILDFQDKEFEDINVLTMNFPVMNYKDRLIDGSLTDVDFVYSFENTKPYSTKYMYNEMTSRLKNNGFKANPPEAIEDYPEKQNTIQPGEFLEIEPDIVEYIQKIIDLCKEKDVELIFYRSPYTSKKNELRKLNHLRQICAENEVLFIDLEEEIPFDYTTDFLDYQHLSEIGANKATDLLAPYILEGLGKTAEPKTVVRTNMLKNSDLKNPENRSGQTTFVGKGETVDGWKTNFSADTVTITENGIQNTITSTQKGWHFYQVVENVEELWGESVTAYFSVPDYSGEFFAPIISCRNEEDKEIGYGWVELREGVCTVSYVIPPATKSLRVGIYAKEGAAGGDQFTVETVELYKGAFTAQTLPRE